MMNTWLNEKFTEWNGFDSWQKTAYGTAIGLFFVLAIYGSYQYWLFNWSLIDTPVLLLVFLMIYAVLLALLSSVSLWICGYLGALTALLFSSIRWIYHKVFL
ncbi:hypothetical protein ACWIUA_11200 [Ursidibacter sp. B-7004-1]